MAFNVSSFIKDSSKSAITRLIDRSVGSVVNGLPMGTTSIATSVSQSLIQGGSAFSTADTLTSLKTDSVISGAADAFFALAGKEISRVGGSSIADLRRTSTDSLTSHLLHIQPETKIAANKSKDSFEILSVL